jgi:cation-transporting ATPase E
MQVVAADLATPENWVCTGREAFSSSRKWSAASFAGRGTWIIGAPEVLLESVTTDDASLKERVDGLASQGHRVLLVAHADHDLGGGGALPVALSPVALVTLREEIRPDAAETLRYLQSQDVDIKIISGDNPRTVASIAAAVGVPGADKIVDLRGITDIDSVVTTNTIFGRASPEQKRDLITAFQESGHTVAMTGDGVNDILALKRADIAIAMDTATPATKAVSQLVLLDGRFDRFPVVIAEGRRVIANMERVSALFITKTVYATLLAIAVGGAGLTFPFLPRHLSLVGAATIGIPAFVLSFWPSKERAKPGFLRRTLRFSIPAGTTAAFITFAVYATVRSGLVNASQTESRTAATITLALVAFWILYRLIRPLHAPERTLIAVCLVGFTSAFFIPTLADFYALDLPRLEIAVAITGATLLNIVLLEAFVTMMVRHGWSLRERGP